MQNPSAMELNYGIWKAGGEDVSQNNPRFPSIEESLARHEPRNLVDVLFAIKVARIGDPLVVEESNRHVILKIICRDRKTPDRDSYIREYVNVAMSMTGKYPNVRVAILFNGPVSDNFLILKIYW
ncbi:MAG: hypothetical protein GYA21_11655 [Myxococcales bacterium]|nr:hypothetical protein [Myxococcales bacterium]